MKGLDYLNFAIVTPSTGPQLILKSSYHFIADNTSCVTQALVHTRGNKPFLPHTTDTINSKNNIDALISLLRRAFKD